MTHYKFLTNNDENDVVYIKKNNFLYVVMSNLTDSKERSLFIFDLITVSHNSLKSIIELDKNNFSQQVYLLINSADVLSTIYVFVYNEQNYFRLIKFKPENLLRK